MHARKLAVALLALLLTLPAAVAQKPGDKEGTVGDPKAAAAALKATGSKVDGLTLPDNFEVDYDEQFVTLQAQCAGPVQFLVLSTADKIKYKLAKEGDSSIDIGVPPKDCLISVFAVGFLKDANKFTPFARCDIHVRGPTPLPPSPPPDVNPPQPPPDPLPDVPALGKDVKLHITIVEDPLNRTQATRNVVDDLKLRQTLTAAGHLFRVRDPNNETTKALGFTDAARSVGLPALIIQVNDGQPGVHPPRVKMRLPATSEGVLAVIAKLQGGN